MIEQYTLILKHEINADGEMIQLEQPIIARYVLPLSESDKYGRDLIPRPYLLDKIIMDLVQIVRDKAMEE